MDAYEYSELLKLLNTKLNNIKGILKPDLLNQRLQEIIELESNQDFWNDIENATKIGIEKNRILGKLNKFNKAYESLNGTNELYEMANSEKDEDTLELLYEEANDLEDLIKSTEISVMLSNPDDTLNAIVTIHPGAGGTESQDWASILYRMYLRWAERNDFKIELLDYQNGDEAGIKDVSFIIKGENAYGYMKAENGIHRLVRISPFDSNAKRHTSFSSVMVSPEIDDNINIVIEDKDIRIDTYRASGAGGTESQDWASILYRMYLRWAERNDFKVEVLDYQAGDEAGIKDVSFVIRGENAYGYMKTENGIHRLVRISPFDSNAKRHTSFSSVMVSPEIDDNIDIVIEDKDIRIDTYRASGAGGQHVNKTESAIRITHIATNIVVQCQNDRSQHKNKASAMKMLKSRLYELELEKQRASKDTGDKSENGWGHQIRSYVLQPYQQVKDSRSNIGYSNVEAILDGDITKIMEDVLIATNTN